MKRTSHGSGGDDDGAEPEFELITPELQPAEPEFDPGTQSRWVKPLSCYERRETTIVEGLRYG